MKILYHKNCNDGSGAALAVWLKLGDAGNEYIPVQYGELVPEGMKGEDVLMVDFSYKRDVILELAKTAKSILILDHHKSAEAELKDFTIDGQKQWNRHLYKPSLCHIDAVFNMEKSGAILAWEHYNSGPIPAVLLHIQDRDLWQLKLANTQAIAAALQLYPNFRDWQRFVRKPELLVTELAPKGQGIIEFLAAQTAKVIQNGPRLWEITGVTVPIYNLPGFMISTTLHAALEKYPEAPYAVAYFDLLDDTRVYSLRSRKGSDVDVAEIAVSFGGGGHKHAAGFKTAK